MIPVEGGCLFCGVGHQLSPAVTVAREGLQNAARDLWIPKRAGTQALGGQPSPTQLSEYLCRICADAVAHVGFMGPSALERALVAHLAPQGIPKLASGNLLTVSGLQGWGALAATRKVQSNSQPFEHLGDLADLRKQLKARLRV